MEILTNDEKKLIEEIIEINENLYYLYQKLYNLELKNQIYSIEYKKIISYIKMVKEELELDVYSKLMTLNYGKKSAIFSFLKEKEQMLNNLRITNSILHNLKQHLSFDTVSDIFNKVFNEFEINEDLKENVNNIIYSCSQVYATLESDINNLTLFFLEEEIQKSNNKSSLLKIKYDFIFAKKELEDEIINNDLKAPCFPNVFMCGQIYNLEQSFIKFFVDRHLSTLLDKEIEDLLDENISNKRLIYKKSYIRSLFTLMSEEEIENCNYLFNEFIESKEYLLKHPTNKEKEEIIKKLFRNINKDKRKVLTIK